MRLSYTCHRLNAQRDSKLWMEEVQRSKRRRVYSFEPNVIAYTTFSQKYMSYLLPALLQATSVVSCTRKKDKDLRKKIRFEVDMALVFSSGGFQWSRALKHNLEQGKNTFHFSIVEELDMVEPIQLPIPRSLVPVEAPGVRSSSKTRVQGDEELGLRLRTLRRILPGGREMGMCELLYEVETYIVCLQMQVNILRSLVGAH